MAGCDKTQAAGDPSASSHGAGLHGAGLHGAGLHGAGSHGAGGPSATGRIQAPSWRELLLSVGSVAAGFALTLGVTQALGWSPDIEQLPAALAMGVGVGIASRRQWRGLPLLLAAPVAGVLIESWLGGQTLLMGGGLLGVATAFVHLRPEHRPMDLLNGALAGVAAAALSTLLVLDGLGLPWEAELLLAGVGASAVLLPALLRWLPRAHVPSEREIVLTLSEARRPPVRRAAQLFAQLKANTQDQDMLDGLAEIAGWVYNLSLSLQTIGQQLDSVDRPELVDRIELLAMEIEETQDEFTRDRRLATAKHLQQLLKHADLLALEQERIGSLQDYAVAYLEEARIGLTLALALPGEQTPGRLDEVLERLRMHAVEGDARRQSAREVQALGAA